MQPPLFCARVVWLKSMRLAGTLNDESQARTFADYLATLGIDTRVEPEALAFGIWVRDDDHLPRGKTELDLFRQEPQHARYQEVQRAARQLRAEQARKDAQIRKNLNDGRKLWEVRPSACPATKLLIALSVLVFAVASLPEKEAPTRNLLQLVPDDDLQGGQPQSRSAIERGEVWRLITPIFLHAPWNSGFGILHLLFNMFWLQDLGVQIESRRGSLRFLALVLTFAIGSNLAEFWASGQGNFGGMSGVVYGLFGYVWMRAKYDTVSTFFISAQSVQVMLIWLVLCWTGLVGPIANVAHTSGLLLGMAVAVPPIWLRRQKARSRKPL